MMLRLFVPLVLLRRDSQYLTQSRPPALFHESCSPWHWAVQEGTESDAKHRGSCLAGRHRRQRPPKFPSSPSRKGTLSFVLALIGLNACLFINAQDHHILGPIGVVDVNYLIDLDWKSGSGL